MITSKEIATYWKGWTWLMIKWNAISFFGFISTAVIWAFVLKHVFKVKRDFWLLNDTVDGDFGAEWWLKEKGLKPSLWSAFQWWFRNHSWNYIRKFNPPWNAGQTEEFQVIKNTLSKTDPDYGKFTRADKKNQIYGTNYIAYRIDGEVYCQYSHANRLFTFQIGSGGDRQRFKFYF